MAARSTRDRPAKPPLSRAAIVGAGLVVLQRDGFRAVTMRSVADELDTGPASLYVYVANRDELLLWMYDAVAGEIELPVPDAKRWREQFKQLLRDSLAAMDRYPGIAHVAMSNIPGAGIDAAAAERGTHQMDMAEAFIALLRAGGVGPQAAAWAADFVALYLTATAVEHAIYAERGTWTEAHFRESIGALRKTMAGLPADRYPFLSTMATTMTVGDGEVRFEFAIDVLINGLLATQEPPTPPDWL